MLTKENENARTSGLPMVPENGSPPEINGLSSALGQPSRRRVRTGHQSRLFRRSLGPPAILRIAPSDPGADDKGRADRLSPPAARPTGGRPKHHECIPVAHAERWNATMVVFAAVCSRCACRPCAARDRRSSWHAAPACMSVGAQEGQRGIACESGIGFSSDMARTCSPSPRQEQDTGAAYGEPPHAACGDCTEATLLR